MNSAALPRHRPARGAGILFAVSVAALLALPLGGCAGGGKKTDELARLTNENAALREENGQIQRELEQLRADRDSKRYQGDPAGNPDEFGPGTTTTHGGGEVVVEIAGDVLFDSGSIALKSTSKTTLNRVASGILDRYSSNKVRVEGYTDTDPIKKSHFESNEDLSARRALAVEKYLVSRGVDADSIYSAAMGPANPKNTKKASRRVEIVILGVN